MIEACLDEAHVVWLYMGSRDRNMRYGILAYVCDVKRYLHVRLGESWWLSEAEATQMLLAKDPNVPSGDQMICQQVPPKLRHLLPQTVIAEMVAKELIGCDA